MRSWRGGLSVLLFGFWAAAAFAATPSAQAALQALEARAKATESDAVVVLQDGKPLLDYRRAGAAPAPIEMMSCTKSLVALGIGRLLAQGRLRSLDQPVADLYPEWKQCRKAAITVRMLLNHTSGLQDLRTTSTEVYPAPDGLQLALAAELSNDPGQRFFYSNKAMNLLAGVIERASHERMDRYLQREILEPLGIRGTTWSRASGYDRAGHPYAMAGWVATAADAARVGQFVLDQGRVGDRVLVEPGFVREMLVQSQPLTPSYGLLWWLRARRSEWRVDPNGLDRAARLGVTADLLDRLRPLSGQTFPDVNALRQAFGAALGPDLSLLARDLAAHNDSLEGLVHQQMGPVEAYEANGYLGQFIVVVPAARLVAVRQIKEREEGPEDKPWPYGFEDFTTRVLELSDALLGR